MELASPHRFYFIKIFFYVILTDLFLQMNFRTALFPKNTLWYFNCNSGRIGIFKMFSFPFYKPQYHVHWLKMNSLLVGFGDYGFNSCESMWQGRASKWKQANGNIPQQCFLSAVFLFYSTNSLDSFPSSS